MNTSKWHQIRKAMKTPSCTLGGVLLLFADEIYNSAIHGDKDL